MTFKQGSCCWDSAEHLRRKRSCSVNLEQKLQCKFGARLLKSAEWLQIHCGVSEVQSSYFFFDGNGKKDLLFPGLDLSWDVPTLSVQCHCFHCYYWEQFLTDWLWWSAEDRIWCLLSSTADAASPEQWVLGSMYEAAQKKKINCKFGCTKKILCSMMQRKIPNICH